jgi:hypothetical protein
MDAAMMTAIGALIVGVMSAAAAMYGSRGANRAAQEGNAVTGFNSLTDQLQEELKEKRGELSAARTELAAKDLEIARLRKVVTDLGGTP